MSKTSTTTASVRMAAMVVGIAFLISVILVTIVDDLLLANFVIPGDTSALARDIETNPTIFLFASLGYLAVLVLDSIIGVGLYVVLRPVNWWMAALTGTLRLLYAGTLMTGVLALSFQMIDVHDYAVIKVVGYVFFAFHVLLLGFVVLVSRYFPKILGVLLMVAALTYAVFFIDSQMPESISILTMLTMAVAEIALFTWLLLKRKSLPDMGPSDVAGAA